MNLRVCQQRCPRSRSHQIQQQLEIPELLMSQETVHHRDSSDRNQQRSRTRLNRRILDDAMRALTRYGCGTLVQCASSSRRSNRKNDADQGEWQHRKEKRRPCFCHVPVPWVRAIQATDILLNCSMCQWLQQHSQAMTPSLSQACVPLSRKKFH